MKPTKPITDPSFRYVPAFETDIRKRFEGVRWQMARAGIEPKIVRMPPLEVESVMKVPR